MTLSPVFRSPDAVRLLQQQGVWDRLAPSLAVQTDAVRTVRRDLEHVIGRRFRAAPDAAEADAELTFLQDYFFLTLFLSVFEGLGVPPERLPFYAQLDFCIMGTITAADNLFDDQDKSHLPLEPSSGARYNAILQILCFERLARRVCDRAADRGLIPHDRVAPVQQGLLDLMAEIGRLEGAEENGVDAIPSPDRMIDQVHRVRGGLLFGLALVAPTILEEGETRRRLGAAGAAIRRLGTAFQIVDDLTDFEFDLTRRSHNLLVSQIHHHGPPEARARLDALWAGEPPEPGLVEGLFADSARAVVEQANLEARRSFQTLADLGFWFPPDLADEVVRAIVGLDGVTRINAISAPRQTPL